MESANPHRGPGTTTTHEQSDPLLREEVGQVFSGRYDVIRRLGVGGMADVYLARDRRLGRHVALKVLGRSYGADPSFVERFRREARAAAALSHPNVVSIFDWGALGETHFMVLEYVPGPSLKDVLRERGHLPETQALQITAEVAAGLAAAHRQGLVHRDVKPDNILFDAEGRVKVTDFGIARAAGAAQLTQDNAILGTAHYLSPEHVQGQAADVRSDVYSLGVVLYALLTGRLPFDGDSAVAVALQHVHAPVVPPRQVRPELAEVTQKLVLRALEKDPSRRFQTASEMQTALEAAYTHLTATRIEPGANPSGKTTALAAVGEATRAVPTIHAARPENPLARTSHTSDRPAWLRAWPLVLLVLVALLVVGGLARLFEQVPRAPDAVAEPATVTVPPKAPATVATALTLPPTVPPIPAPAGEPTSPVRSKPAPGGASAVRPTAPATSAQPPTAAGASVANAEAAEQAVGAVRNFYERVAGGEYERAAALWSPAMIAAFPPGENIEGRFSKSSDLRAQRVEALSVDEITGRATVAVDVEETVGGERRRWIGTWELVRTADGGGWLLNKPNLSLDTRAFSPLAPPSVPASATLPSEFIPSPTASAPVTDPLETIRQHYRLIDLRRFEEGYELMSGGLRAAHSLAVYRSWFANKVGLVTEQVWLVSSTDTRAIVESVVESSDRVGDEVLTQRVSERFSLVLEDRVWRIERVTRL